MPRIFLLGVTMAMGVCWMGACGSPSGTGTENTPTATYTPPTCSQTCQDYLVSSGVADTVWFAYNQNVAGQPGGAVDRTAACPLGGNVHITGTASSKDGITSVHLVFEMKGCASSDSYYTLAFTGTVNMDGTFSGGTNAFTAITFTSQLLAVSGSLEFFDDPSVDESVALSAKQEGSGDSATLAGRVGGRDFSSETALQKSGTGSSGTSGTGGAPSTVTGGPGCPSIYDGTYSGLWAYDYRVEGNPPTTGTSSFSLTVELKCVAAASGSVVLNVTHAQANDAYFGCQVGGCTPSTGSVATLPATPPTSPSSPSRAGQGIVVLFPNGATLGTENDTGDLTVSTDGRTLSNSLTGSTSSWSAVDINVGSAFPGQSGKTLTSAKSWTLNKSAL